MLGAILPANLRKLLLILLVRRVQLAAVFTQSAVELASGRISIVQTAGEGEVEGREGGGFRWYVQNRLVQQVKKFALLESNQASVLDFHRPSDRYQLCRVHCTQQIHTFACRGVIVVLLHQTQNAMCVGFRIRMLRDKWCDIVS